jgi:hypothetical protein
MARCPVTVQKVAIARQVRKATPYARAHSAQDASGIVACRFSAAVRVRMTTVDASGVVGRSGCVGTMDRGAYIREHIRIRKGTMADRVKPYARLAIGSDLRGCCSPAPAHRARRQHHDRPRRRRPTG